MSGHNKWSSIKHRKVAQDAKRGKLFTKIIKEITIAARTGGGDASGNPALRRALDLARANNMPQDNVTRAIKKGTGELEGVHYEELVYEGVGPGGSLFVLKAVTDNRNRSAAELRKLFDKHHGQLGSSGAAAWAFEEKGMIKLPIDVATEEQLFEVAVGAGAEDLSSDETQWFVTTPRDDLDVVRAAMEAAGIEPEEAALVQVPTTPKELDGKEALQAMQLYEALEEHDDVESVFADFELSEAALAALDADE